MFMNSRIFPFQQITMSGCRVFIGRLSPHARERDVEKFFKGYGRIREINLKNGFGFVVSATDPFVWIMNFDPTGSDTSHMQLLLLIN